jgi:Protein of unknown function (DUF2917)
MQANWIHQVVSMPKGSALRLKDARGVALGIDDGMVWITEEGVAEDNFLSSGAEYAVVGGGVVIVSAECDARVNIQGGRAPLV